MEDERFESRDALRIQMGVVIRSTKDAQAFSQINRLLREELDRLCEEAFGWRCNYGYPSTLMIVELFEVYTFSVEFVTRLYGLQECVDLGLAFKLDIQGLGFLKENTVEILSVLQNAHSRR